MLLRLLAPSMPSRKSNRFRLTAKYLSDGMPPTDSRSLIRLPRALMFLSSVKLDISSSLEILFSPISIDSKDVRPARSPKSLTALSQSDKCLSRVSESKAARTSILFLFNSKDSSRRNESMKEILEIPRSSRRNLVSEVSTSSACSPLALPAPVTSSVSSSRSAANGVTSNDSTANRSSTKSENASIPLNDSTRFSQSLHSTLVTLVTVSAS